MISAQWKIQYQKLTRLVRCMRLPSSRVLSKMDGELLRPSPIRVKAKTWISYRTYLPRPISWTLWLVLPSTAQKLGAVSESFSLYTTWNTGCTIRYFEYHAYIFLLFWNGDHSFTDDIIWELTFDWWPCIPGWVHYDQSLGPPPSAPGCCWRWWRKLTRWWDRWRALQ